MPGTETIFIGLIFVITALTSCKDKDNSILNDKNFDEGKWLLVVENKVESTLFVIDDKRVLKENPFGLTLGPSAYCGGTTCDGFIDLYKDGKLIASQEYLSKSDLIENEDIRQAYKIAITDCIRPGDEKKFKQQWDSLERIKNTYPTRRHIQPEDKDIICFYKYQ